MTRRLASLVSLLLLMAATLASADERRLKIAATEYPPYYGTDLEDQGFITEIVIAAFGRGGYEIDIEFLPWKRALENTKQGKSDALFTVWYRAEREEWFLFSDPLPPNELAFFKRSDEEISYTGFDSLKAHTIGVVRGYAPPPGFAEASLTTSEAKDDTENLRKLHKGRVDLVLADKILATHIIASQMPELAADLEWIDPPVSIENQHLVVSKAASDSEIVLERFNAGLTGITDDGTLELIINKHGFGG